MPPAIENVPNIRLAEPADGMALGRLHIAAWHETYQGLVPDSLLGGLDPEKRGMVWEEMLRDPGRHQDVRVHLAEQDGEMIGFAACGAQMDETLAAAGFDGEIGAIYLRRAAQGRGLGRLLMRTAAADLRGRGFRGASLWVLVGNRPARRFYEHLGGIVVGEKRDVRPEGELVEVAYGWSDLHLLDCETTDEQENGNN